MRHRKRMLFYRQRLFSLLFLFIIGGYWCHWSTTGTIGGKVNSRYYECGISIGKTNGTVEGYPDSIKGTYGFWYSEIGWNICVTVSPDNWTIGTIPIDTVVLMSLGQEISVYNCGNCDINLGLQFLSSTPLSWIPGTVTDNNQFVLMAFLSRDRHPPESYGISDYIRDTLVWIGDGVYGMSRSYLLPNDTYFLWLRFASPTWSHSFVTNTIIMAIYTKRNLP